MFQAFWPCLILAMWMLMTLFIKIQEGLCGVKIILISSGVKPGEGIGGPHIGYDMVWPMSIMMKAFTSRDDEEIKWCIKLLMDTDAGTGFMHESFHKDDPANFTRAWFAWQNTLFGELILKLVNEGKVDLLNSIENK